MKNIAIKRVGIAIGLTILLVVAGYFYLRSSLPKTEGVVVLSGLDGQIEIVRDADGVPHIFASTDADAYFALGYVHAQDRLWQLEMNRRIGSGRLSEVLGEATLDIDKFLRTLGTYRAAIQTWDFLTDDTRDALESYASGVNAWIDEGHTLPPEYLILGFTPEPWTVYDSLVWSKMMMWDLGGNWEDELLRSLLQSSVGQDRANELVPGYPSEATTIIPGDLADTLLGVDSTMQQMFRMGDKDVGSNSWVVSGDLTESGKPLLANDPHLGAQIPSIWYLVELQGNLLHATGATLLGMPIIPIGHNEHVAWGLTNLGPDVQDLYIERINPTDPNQYEVDGEWEDMTIVLEEILVKDDEDTPIPYAARSTRHGPLISDVSDNAGTPLAMRWTALDPGDTTADAFMKMAYASDWDEFTDALRYYVAPSQNMVFADQKGNIGYIGPGRIPVRAKGDGTVPVPGWDSEYEWEGWIPFEQLPQVYNPESGYIVTANNKVVSDDYPFFISSSWAPRYRADRIEELILQFTDGDSKISIEDMIAIQSDQISRQAIELLPYLQAVEPSVSKSELAQLALDHVITWDADMSADSVAATIYATWFHQLGMVIFEDELRGNVYEQFADRKHASFLVNVLEEPDNPWCDNVLTVPNENCLDAAASALDRATEFLEDHFKGSIPLISNGRNVDKWKWGELHETIYSHNPFSEVAALRMLFQREIGNGGGSYTVNVGPYKFSDPYKQIYVPSYRQIVDLNDWSNSLFMHTTGQSGNVFSKHYDDLIERHQAVEYLPMSFGRANIKGDVLVLKPE